MSSFFSRSFILFSASCSFNCRSLRYFSSASALLEEIFAYRSSYGVSACKGLTLPATLYFRSFFTNIDGGPRLERGVRLDGWFIICRRVIKYWLWILRILCSTSCKSSSFLSDASWISLWVWLIWLDKTFIYCLKSESDLNFSVSWYYLNTAVLLRRVASWIADRVSLLSRLSLLSLSPFFFENGLFNPVASLSV